VTVSTLRKRFADEVVGAHLQAEQFVDLLFFRCEEDHWQVQLLAQPAQGLQAVHTWHLDIENGQVRLRGLKIVER
jgi:hypothetical protein